VKGDFAATCLPAPGSSQPVSGSPFTITCNASDNATPPNAATPTTFKYIIIVAAPNNPPDITVPADITAEATGPGGAVVTYSASASDPDPGDTVQTFACVPASGSTFPLGVTTVTCTATANHGATSTKSFTITVKDTTAPVFDGGPANGSTITKEATSPAGAVVTYAAITATDAVDGSVTPDCQSSPTTGLSSGSAFPLGDTTINCTAHDSSTDGSGPGGHNVATLMFTVRVQGTAGPGLTVPSDKTVVVADQTVAPVA